MDRSAGASSTAVVVPQPATRPAAAATRTDLDPITLRHSHDDGTRTGDYRISAWTVRCVAWKSGVTGAGLRRREHRDLAGRTAVGTRSAPLLTDDEQLRICPTAEGT